MGDWLGRNRGYVFVTLLNLVAVGLVILWIQQPRPASMLLEMPTPVMTPTEALLRVYVCGQVAKADVYLLPPGSIVKDALLKAGGPTGQADLLHVNLALPVNDGDQIYVPKIGEETAPAPSASPGKQTTGKININKATVEELESLPGIGPTYARRIIEYRKRYGPFQAIEDLERVEGIGPTTLERIRDLITMR